MAGGDVPVATVNPESIRELYRESFRTRAQVQRGSMGRARCGTIASGLNVGDVSNVLLCARVGNPSSYHGKDEEAKHQKNGKPSHHDLSPGH